MDFLKKNYEKVLLGVVLLGLVGAIVWVWLKIQDEKAWLADQRIKYQPRVKQLPPVELDTAEAALKQLQSGYDVELTNPHTVINPATWILTPDGRTNKLDSSTPFGPSALKVLDIEPLYLRLSFDSTNSGGYVIAVTREDARKSSDRMRQTRIVSLKRDCDLFALKEVKGPPDRPTELVLEMADSGKIITIKPPAPYQEVVGYKADLYYGPDKKTFRDCRKDDSRTSRIYLEGEWYNVVDINQSEVVLSALSNGRKTTIHYEPGAVAR